LLLCATASSCGDPAEKTVTARITNDTGSTVYIARCKDSGCSETTRSSAVLTQGREFWQHLAPGAVVPFELRRSGQDGPKSCVELTVGSTDPSRPKISEMRTVECD